MPSIEHCVIALAWSAKKWNVAVPLSLGFAGPEVTEASGVTPVPRAIANREKLSGSAHTRPADGSLVTVTSTQMLPSKLRMRAAELPNVAGSYGRQSLAGSLQSAVVLMAK